MYKGDIGEEAYYIADGRASILKANKRTVFSRIKEGVCFGEIGLFLKCRRTYYVQAETHCCVYVLRRSDMHALLKKFPEVEVRVRNYSEMLLSKIQEREAKINNEEQKFLDNLSTIMEEKAIKEELTKPPLTAEERKQFELISIEEHKQTQNPIANLRKKTEQTDRGCGRQQCSRSRC
eukprot:TRINITY_DN15430_c0_g4_i1.p1 TRINITY_DN15430_c0_g4~~TRINITY_DN15430_c0_g4_i1.p1  ORF type:complete len:178 (+),score=41.35 TRINITY_DN15430_c0_g4_i1:152-685(+)